MSKTIDHRIVEMRFDNKQFEAGAKETMGTLGKLKEALKLPNTGKALEGIDKATKGIKLDGIAAGVEALERRFSTLGIVGMRVIENITDGLMNKVHAAVSFVTDSIVSGGIKRAMNIENAHFQLQALLKDETKVQAVMADAMESVDGTAYAYDEAAKAASQFAASGIQAGDEMLNALKGITGVAAMTNSSFEDISRVFTTVAGNGRLMGDQLLQLSSRGLNAASTLADYFREVRGQTNMTEAAIREMVSKGQISFKDFSDAMTWAFGDSAKRANETFTGAMSNMKSALARIGADFVSPLVEQNGEIVQLFNALRIKINDVRSALKFDEQRSAIAGLAETTGMTNDELSDMFDTIKKNGSVTINDLDMLKRKGASGYTALTKYINGVTDGSIRASYAIKTALGDLTNGTEVSMADVRRFVEEGKIDLSTFTAAMEKEFGTEKTLAKQFTDWFLDHVHGIVEAVNSADMTKPMEIFYYWVESVKNIAKGLISVIKPVGEAFADVFLGFNSDDLITFSEAVEKLTAKMRLSEKGSKNLHDAFKGVFSVVKLLVDIFFDLLGVIVPINKPVIEMGDGFLGLAGSMGRGLTTFTEMIRSCDLLKRAFGVLSGGFSLGMDALSKLIKIGKNFIVTLSEMDGPTKLINAVVSAFEKLATKAIPYIEDFINESENMFKSLFNLKDINLDRVLETISQAFSDLAWEIDHFGFKTLTNGFDAFRQKVKALEDLLMSNNGINTFIKNAKKYGEELKEAFSWGSIMERLEKIMEVFGKFFRWVKETMAPAFEDFNFGSAVAAGGGFGIIYALIKVSKAFEKMSGTITAIPNLLNGIKGTLVAYQKDLKASALLKTAAAIAVLAGALVLLSFADTDRIMEASVALSLIAGTLILGVSKLLDAVNKGRELNDALRIFSKGLSSTMKKFGRAQEIKAFGSAVKNMAKSIAIVAASIIALGLMYKKDPDSFNAAIQTIGKISIILAAMSALIVVGSKIGDTKGMSSIGKSVLMITASLGLVVLSISKLMKIELPDDYKTKLAILGGIIAGLGVLAVILAAAAKISGGNDLPKIAGSIKSLAILLVGTVLSLKILFAMKLPDDYKTKLAILGGIFAGFGILILAMGAAAKLAEGNGFKAAGTILSMAAFLVVVVGSLFVLTLIPGDKMLKGALALGGILVALGAALYGAGQISDKNAYKSVIAMALTVGVITAALAVLSMISWQNLLKSTAALGSILVALALNFREISKMNAKDSITGILGMIAVVLTMAYSLYTLAQQPWENLLAGAVGLSAVLLSLTACFGIIGKMNPDIGLITAFATAASILVGIVSYSLYQLAQQPWENLLAGAVGLSAVLLSLTACLAILTKVEANIGTASQAALALSSFIVILGTVMTAVGILFTEISSLEGYLDKGIEILIKIGNGLGRFIGAIFEGVFSQISNALPVIGQNLSDFWDAASVFFDGIGSMDDGLPEKVAKLAACLIALTVAELVSAIGSFMGIGFVALGVELSGFMLAALPFFQGLNNIDPESLQAAKNIGSMILALTAADVLSGIAGIFGLTGSLSDFAEELKAFGPAIADFAETVKDVNPEAVQGAASAAEIMATMAEKLPNQGGLAAKIFGDNTLSSFGDELIAFAPKIVSFANWVKNVDASAVTGAALATTIMSNLADNLPNSETLWSKIFGGGQVTLSEFGNELVKFGTSMSNFSDSVSGIDIGQINGAITSFKSLIDLANYVQGSSASDLVNFSNQLGKIGTDSVDKFVQAFVDADIKVSTAFSNIINAITTAIQNQNVTLTALGTESAIAWINGIISQYPNATLTGMMFVTNVLLALQLQIPNFLIEGTASATQYLKGIRNLYPEATSTGQALAQKVLSGIKTTQSSFYTAGSAAGQGFVDGLKSMMGASTAAGEAIGKAAYEAAKKALDVHSPSRKMGEVGENTGLGFVNKLMLYVAKAANAGKEIGEAAIDGTKSGLQMLDDVGDIVLHPRVDMGNIYSSVKEIEDLFNNAINNIQANAINVNTQVQKVKNGTFENVQDPNKPTSNGITNYSFNQYNTSPKALSRVEIYRDTKNLMSQFKEATNRA